MNEVLVEAGLFPEKIRIRSARVLGFGLTVQAGVAGGAGFSLLLAGIDGAVPGLLLFVGCLTLFGLSTVAAVLEVNREHLAEAVAVPCTGLGFALSLAMLLGGWFLLGPLLAAATGAVSLALADRLMVRDEARHQPVRT